MLWWANAALYFQVPGTNPKTRSAVRVDGVDAYNPSSAYSTTALRDNPGFPALSSSHSIDPVTGDLTIEETDPFVSCSPQPAVYPPTDVSCASVDAPKVRLVRTLKQQRNGLQVTIVDRWQSLDGLAHELDAYYDQTVSSTNSATVGHGARFGSGSQADRCLLVER